MGNFQITGLNRISFLKLVFLIGAFVTAVPMLLLLLELFCVGWDKSILKKILN